MANVNSKPFLSYVLFHYFQLRNFILDCPVNHPDTNSTGDKVTSTKIGTVLTYTCNSDTSITLTSKCRGDGTWTSSAFSCDEPLLDTPGIFFSVQSNNIL